MNIINQVKKTTIVLISLSALVFGATAYAKPHQNKCPDAMRSSMQIIFKHLDLSDEQITQIRALKAANKETMQSIRATHQETGPILKEQMRELLMAEEFDQDAYIALHKKIAETKSGSAMIRAKAMHAVFQVLTDEQKEEFKTIQEERRGLRQSKRNNGNSKRNRNN